MLARKVFPCDAQLKWLPTRHRVTDFGKQIVRRADRGFYLGCKLVNQRIEDITWRGEKYLWSSRRVSSLGARRKPAKHLARTNIPDAKMRAEIFCATAGGFTRRAWSVDYWSTAIMCAVPR